MHRVAITGLGWVTALGSTVATTWPRLLAGENGIRPIASFDASRYACSVAAEVPEAAVAPTDLETFPPASCRRSVRLFLQVVREAWSDAGLPPSVDRSRAGVFAGVSVNYMHVAQLAERYRHRRADGLSVDLARYVDEADEAPGVFTRRVGDLAATLPAKVLGCSGPSLAVDTACAASAHAVGLALRTVQRGEADVMIAGGSSALVNPFGILAFALLGALSRNADPATASRPFDRRRDGFVMGEGAGAVVLERLDAARDRGARIYGELAGFGSTTTAVSLTQPSPDGASEAAAMQAALDDAGLAPASIDFVAAHGTSTPLNDVVETHAIKRVFGDGCRRLAVSSNKGQLGHTIAAAGAFNLIAAMKSIETGRVPPTAHHADPDPECDLDYVPNASRPLRVGAALVNAFAFGGQNAVLAVRALDRAGAGEPGAPVDTRHVA